MLQFQIDCKLRYKDVWSYQSSLELNNEWTLRCVWKDLDRKYKLEYIEIRRKKNCEETSISGNLSVRENYDKKRISIQAFSKFMASGNMCMKLIDLPTDITITNYDSDPGASLQGIVNIILIGESISKDLQLSGTKIYFQPKSLVKLSEDFEELLDPQTSCPTDVNLKCGKDSIMAHKLILSARSPVFSAMFKNPMKETQKNEVEIIDIDASVLRAMINYIYTGKTYDLTVSSASDLLFAADKYQLPDLKRVCCDFLMESISLQIVMKIIALGDLYAEDLKSFGMEYVCKNYKTFTDFEGIEDWKTVKEDKPALAVDILSSVLKSKDIK